MHTEGWPRAGDVVFALRVTQFVRPSVGSWVLYGLGSENENLPGFVTIAPSAGNGGTRIWPRVSPRRIPGNRVGTGRDSDRAIQDCAISAPPSGTASNERRHLDQLQKLNNLQTRQRYPHDSELDAAIRSYELAWRMQQVAPRVLDLAGETTATLARYGIGEQQTDNFGRQCLMARRLCEAGVRYVQVTYGDNTANPAWDQHSNLPKHASTPGRSTRRSPACSPI